MTVPDGPIRDEALYERGVATLQATPMAERIYAAAGLRDRGRFLEYAPRV